MNKLMIIAHPDDEILMSGMLPDNEWTVLCLTGANDAIRKMEFFNVSKILGFEGLIVDFQNKLKGWNDEELKSIQIFLDRFVKSKNWSMIVSHNINGEYGHIQHSQLSNIVRKLNLPCDLFEFTQDKNKYFKKIWNIEEIIKLYPSQTECINDPRVNNWFINASIEKVVGKE